MFLRVAYGRFYEPFGVTPDDLGLGYVQLLTQAAMSAVVLLTLYGLLVGIIVASFVEMAGSDFADKMDRSLRQQPSRIRTTAVAVWMFGAATVGLLMVALAVLAVVSVLYSWVAGYVGFMAGSAAIAFVAFFALMTYRGTRRMRRELSRANLKVDPPPVIWWRPMVIAMTIVAAVVVLVLFGFTLISGANSDARDVRHGRPAEFSLLGTKLTSWGAETATLSSTASTVGPALRGLSEGCVMYLGQSDGTIFVYRRNGRMRGTFRIPAATTAVRIMPDGHCANGRGRAGRP